MTRPVVGRGGARGKGVVEGVRGRPAEQPGRVQRVLRIAAHIPTVWWDVPVWLLLLLMLVRILLHHRNTKDCLDNTKGVEEVAAHLLEDSAGQCEDGGGVSVVATLAVLSVMSSSSGGIRILLRQCSRLLIQLGDDAAELVKSDDNLIEGRQR